MVQDYSLFRKKITDIMRLPRSGKLLKDDLLTVKFLLHRENENGKELAIYYAPFEYVNRAAKVVLIGITPGWTQMEIAYREANRSLRAGLSVEEVLKRTGDQATFSGMTRTNLVKMLDGIGMAEELEIRSCSLLFDRASHLVHTTSAVRHPVFVNGGSYSGYWPDMTRQPVLRRYITEILADELQSMPFALVIPLGKAVSSAVRLLIDNNALDGERCLQNFPHPSGANASRVREYDLRKDDYAATVRRWYRRWHA
jgi:hypothetical protein